MPSLDCGFRRCPADRCLAEISLAVLYGRSTPARHLSCDEQPSSSGFPPRVRRRGAATVIDFLETPRGQGFVCRIGLHMSATRVSRQVDVTALHGCHLHRLPPGARPTALNSLQSTWRGFLSWGRCSFATSLFIQMLSPAEADELALYFTLVDTPTLRSEIVADFNKPEGARQLPLEVVRSLANKLSRSGAAHPAEFSKIAAANLHGTEVSMIGQVPVDTTAPDVCSSDGMLLIDAVPQQRTWSRITTGELTDEERAEAAVWLDNIGRVDLPAIKAEWEPFVQKYLGPVRAKHDLIAEVDRLLKDRNADNPVDTDRSRPRAHSRPSGPTKPRLSANA